MEQVCRNDPVDCVCCNCRDDEVINSLAPSTTDIIPEACVCCVCAYEVEPRIPSTFQSDITLIPKPSCACHPDDCACCFCTPCEAKKKDPYVSEGNEHAVDCNCCECGAEAVEQASSSISTKSNELDDYPDGVDLLKRIMLVLERVDTEMQQHILRWINIDEDILNSDLAMLDMKNGEMDKGEQREASVCDQRSPVSVPLPVCSFNSDEVSCDKQESSVDTDSCVPIAASEEFHGIQECGDNLNGLNYAQE